MLLTLFKDVLATSDSTRGDFNLLDRGVQVALMYGDRDYSGSCRLLLSIPHPWISISGKRDSLAINSTSIQNSAAAG
jgi:hypothetical protein